jgi:muconolactone D-isomerase
VEFLVKIQVFTPDSMAADQLSSLVSAERARGKELKDAGVIQRIWRIPGTKNNVGVWKAADASELHSAISSLPLFAYMNVEVTPLATHPLES